MLLPPVCAHLSVLIQTERAWRAGTTSLTCVCASVCVCFYTHLGSFCIWNLVSIYFTLKLKIQLHLLCLAQGREMLINICWIICNVCQYLPKWVILHVDLYALEGRHTRSCWARHCSSKTRRKWPQQPTTAGRPSDTHVRRQWNRLQL